MRYCCVGLKLHSLSYFFGHTRELRVRAQRFQCHYCLLFAFVPLFLCKELISFLSCNSIRNVSCLKHLLGFSLHFTKLQSRFFTLFNDNFLGPKSQSTFTVKVLAQLKTLPHLRTVSLQTTVPQICCSLMNKRLSNIR